MHAIDGDPQPRRSAVVIEGESDSALRATMAEPDLIDETLDFGDLSFPRGFAFSLGQSKVDRPEQGPEPKARIARPQFPGEERSGHVPVAKRLVRLSNGIGLVESVPWERVRNQLDTLPARQGASLSIPDSARVKGRHLPVLKHVIEPSQPMKMAALPYEARGFCLDFVTVSGG